jgi:hypothetical protein
VAVGISEVWMSDDIPVPQSVDRLRDIVSRLLRPYRPYTIIQLKNTESEQVNVISSFEARFVVLR